MTKKPQPKYPVPPVIEAHCTDKAQYKKHELQLCNSCASCPVQKRMIDACVIIAAILEERNAVKAGRVLEEANTHFSGCVTKEIIGEVFKKIFREGRDIHQDIQTLIRAFQQSVYFCKSFMVIESGEEIIKLALAITEYTNKSGGFIEDADARHIAAAIIYNMDFITQDEKSIVREEILIKEAVAAYQAGLETQVHITSLSEYKSH